MILVIGATGTNGREVVERLAEAGVPVRALVRDTAKAASLLRPDIELTAGDLDDPESLDAALDGVERALLITSVDRRHVDWVGHVLDAAKRAGTRHVVKFSGMGADPDSPTELMRQHAETDRMLVGSGLAYTILQPNSFHQNLLWSASTIKDQGAFYLPVGDALQSLVDVRDIAAVAVEALTNKGHEGQIYEITGPLSLSYHDVAAALSKVLGKPVRYVDVPLEAARDAMIQAGTPAWNAGAVTDLYRAIADGLYVRTTDVVAQVTGKPPIPFEQFARDYAHAFA